MAIMPSKLLELSAYPFDEACMQVKELEGVLTELVELKDYKDQYGKNDSYEDRKQRAWERARRVLGR